MSVHSISVNEIPIVKPESNSISSLPSSQTVNKIFRESKNLYMGPGYTNVPGMTNALYAPVEFYDNTKAAVNAYRVGDKEGMAEHTLRVVETPFSLASALLQGASNLSNFGIAFQNINQVFARYVYPLSYFIAFLGMVFTTIELGLESAGLYRVSSFSKKFLPPDLQKLNAAIQEGDLAKIGKNLDISADDMNTISDLLDPDAIKGIIYKCCLEKLKAKYLEISPKRAKKIKAHAEKYLTKCTPEVRVSEKTRIINYSLEKKRNRLARRVDARLTEEIAKTVPELINDLRSKDPTVKAAALKKAEMLFDDLHTQIDKKSIIYLVGISAAVITLAGLAMILLIASHGIPLAILIVGGILAVTRYYLNEGWANSKGLDFEYKRCIPAIAMKAFNRITAKKVAEPAPIAVSYKPSAKRKLYHLPKKGAAPHFVYQPQRKSTHYVYKPRFSA